MFIDTRNLPAGDPVRADVCVIGGGAAGISLAMEFADRKVRVVLLECGGLAPEPDGRKSYRIVAAPLKLDIDRTRPWFFGGNTNHWAGNCRPLDEADFLPREWIPYSGWPIRRSELLAYYERAQAVFGLGDFRGYDLEACRPHLKHRPIQVDPSILTSRLMHACPVLSFAELYRERLNASSNIQVLLHARVLKLETSAGGHAVCSAEIVLADGGRTRIEAGVFVLAAGGVENARLLLCSNDADPRGLGNGHDNVGRFFMDHWHFDIPLRDRRNGDDFTLYGGHLSAGDPSPWAQLVLSDEMTRRERVPGLCLWFLRSPSIPLGVQSLSRILGSLRGGGRLEHPRAAIRLLLDEPGEMVKYALKKLGGRHTLPAPESVLRVQIEQPPHPRSRIQLSARKNRFGQALAELTLQLTEDEREGYARCLQRALDEIGLEGSRCANLMRLMFDAGQFGFFRHHMGTTRMDMDPARGVVDVNCRVHGVSNLYVAGSSVFPTGGTASPTLTIVALALRLSDHIQDTCL